MGEGGETTKVRANQKGKEKRLDQSRSLKQSKTGERKGADDGKKTTGMDGGSEEGQMKHVNKEKEGEKCLLWLFLAAIR